VRFISSLSLNVSAHRRRLVRRTVERLVRIFLHAGLCQFEIVWGVCAECWWCDGSRMVHFAITAPSRRTVRIISRQPADMREPIEIGAFLLRCALTGLLFFSERYGSGDPAPCDGYPGPACSHHSSDRSGLFTITNLTRPSSS
jgi:hypothetical protein